MSKIYNFGIDTTFIPHEIEEMYEEWVPIDVELTEEEVSALIKARNVWIESEEFKNNIVDDEEYYLRRYIPPIHQKVRKALEQQAPYIWGEEIMSELCNVDIYLPDDIDWNNIEEL